jgi:CRP/FNR family transcriptional regulator, cyclic AMP receptor protein
MLTWPSCHTRAQVKLVQYKVGETVIEEGTTGTLFGILVSGKLEISARGPGNKEIVLCQQLPGFFFGEAAIIGNTTTNATIKAKENSAILALTSKELEQVRCDCLCYIVGYNG